MRWTGQYWLCSKNTAGSATPNSPPGLACRNRPASGVFAGVRLVRHARADVVAFERAVIRLPEVVHSHHVTGNYDYLLQVEVADLPAYEDFHANQLAALPGVAAVTSYVAMKTLSADTARPAGRRRLGRSAGGGLFIP